MKLRALAMLAVISGGLALLACPGGGSKQRAVPTEVEIEWPDAGVVDRTTTPDAG